MTNEYDNWNSEETEDFLSKNVTENLPSNESDTIAVEEIKESVDSVNIEPVKIIEEKVEEVQPKKVEEKKSASKSKKSQDDKVGIYSSRNLYAANVKSLYKGYNIIPSADADFWIAKRPNEVRLATPEEIAQAFGK